MALPMNSAPTYVMEIPSTKQKVNFRPLLVKEEKALLIAQQSDDTGVMVDTLKNIIRSCILTENINVDSLAVFDLEYIFVQLRAKSVGEFAELFFGCDEDHGPDNEKAKVKININLLDVKVDFPKDHKNKIELFDDVGVIMKYPSLDVIEKINENTSEDIETLFSLVADSIQSIYNTDTVWDSKDQTKEELIEFLNNLSSQQFLKIQDFFITMPKLSHKVKHKCPVCGKNNETVLEGLKSFF